MGARNVVSEQTIRVARVVGKRRRVIVVEGERRSDG